MLTRSTHLKRYIGIQYLNSQSVSSPSSYPLGARHNLPQILNILYYRLRITSGCHIQLTKGIHPTTYLRKLLEDNEVSTKHFISTYEDCSPQNFLASFIHSGVCVCTCEHTLHISIISFTSTFLYMLTTYSTFLTH